MDRKKYAVECPIDNKPCDMKIYKRNIKGLTSGKCRHGEFGEETATFPACEKYLSDPIFNPEDKYDNRKKQPSKAKPKRKICRCK